MYLTIGKMLELTVQKYPNHEALVYLEKNQRWTYSQWNSKINQLANAFLEYGIKKGDRVSAFLYNTSEWVTTLFALAKIGAVYNPINFRLSGGELAFILNDVGSKVLIFEAAVAEQVEVARKEAKTVEKFLFVDDNPPEYAQSFYEFFDGKPEESPKVEVNENDRYIIMYTSGTTGKPKGVIHRHRDILEHDMAMIADQKLTYNDRGLSAAPLNHAAEIHCCFLPRVHAGATNVILHHFEPPKVLEIIAQEKISVLFGAPTMLNMLLQVNLDKYDLSSLRLIAYGGASMAPTMVKKCHQAFSADLLQYYGMTELGPAVTVLYPEDQLTRAGSAGKALLNHEVRVVRVADDDGNIDPDKVVKPGEVGVVIVKGPARMEGYYNRPEATAKVLNKDWYQAGDLARIDKDGYIWIVDRADDMIISGAENIYPREVEDALYEHPEVVEVAVVGIPDEKWGKIVTAYVVVNNKEITPADLDNFLKNSNKLAAFKRPRRYELSQELPKTASGKILKYVLRDACKELKK